MALFKILRGFHNRKRRHVCFLSSADVYIELTVRGSREERTDNDILA